MSIRTGTRSPVTGEKLVKVPEVLQELGVSRRKLYTLIQSRVLKSVRLGHRTILITRSSLDALKAQWLRAAR